MAELEQCQRLIVHLGWGRGTGRRNRGTPGELPDLRAIRLDLPTRTIELDLSFRLTESYELARWSGCRAAAINAALSVSCARAHTRAGWMVGKFDNCPSQELDW